jgi:hypothetical protein
MREHPKLTGSELLQKMLDEPIKNDTIFRHHSGNIYKIVDRTIDCKTNGIILHYKLIAATPSNTLSFSGEDLPFDTTFSRPVEDFVEPRFTKVSLLSFYVSKDEYRKIQELIKENRL